MLFGRTMFVWPFLFAVLAVLLGASASALLLPLLVAQVIGLVGTGVWLWHTVRGHWR